MFFDFLNVSDVDFLLEEVKLLVGVFDEMEFVCNKEIVKIEMKF